MAGIDRTTYGFRSDDADALLNLITMGDVETPIRRPMQGGGNGGVIEYKIVSLATKTTGPYTGLKAASVVIHGAPCNRSSLIGETVEVIDHSNELFDEVSMAGFTGWASEMVFLSLDPEVECDTISPCHWAAINRVCTAATGIYASPCEAATYYVPEGYAPAGYMPVGYV